MATADQPSAPEPASAFRIFIGYDSREDIAYQVCRSSLLKHSSTPLDIIPIRQHELRQKGLYNRQQEAVESTEFSFTRFLTPYLAGYVGWALFVDCDFLYTADVAELAGLCDERYAIRCVQHDYAPTTVIKMDGRIQTTYPRKNWSSMVLYNCGHPKNKRITPDVVNSQTGAYLHRFQWLDDSDIGSVPDTWNWLVGHSQRPADGRPPKAIHYTLGGPWFENYYDCEYADLWLEEAQEYRLSRKTNQPNDRA